VAEAQALGELKHPRAVEPLIAALTDEDPGKAMRRAARALGELGDVRALEPLSAALKSESFYVQQAAKEALRQLGVEPTSISACPLQGMSAGVGNSDRASIEQLARRFGVKPVDKEALQAFNPADIPPEVTGLVVAFRFLVESGARMQAQAARPGRHRGMTHQLSTFRGVE